MTFEFLICSLKTVSKNCANVLPVCGFNVFVPNDNNNVLDLVYMSYSKPFDEDR